MASDRSSSLVSIIDILLRQLLHHQQFIAAVVDDFDGNLLVLARLKRRARGAGEIRVLNFGSSSGFCLFSKRRLILGFAISLSLAYHKTKSL